MNASIAEGTDAHATALEAMPAPALAARMTVQLHASPVLHGAHLAQCQKLIKRHDARASPLAAPACELCHLSTGQVGAQHQQVSIQQGAQVRQ